jgi:hypothetical protein
MFAPSQISPSTFVSAADSITELTDVIVSHGFGSGDRDQLEEEKKKKDLVQQQPSNPSVRPRRIICLAAVIAVLAALVYILHTLCTFLLEITQNESFVTKVADVMKCRRSSDNASFLEDDQKCF